MRVRVISRPPFLPFEQAIAGGERDQREEGADHQLFSEREPALIQGLVVHAEDRRERIEQIPRPQMRRDQIDGIENRREIQRQLQRDRQDVGEIADPHEIAETISINPTVSME